MEELLYGTMAAAGLGGLPNGAKHKLFVGNLPPDLTQEELALVFGTYGNCVDVHIMGGKSTSGQSCAFVVYDSADSAGNAIAALNGIYSFRDGTPPITCSWARQGGDRGPGRGNLPAVGLNAVAPPSSLLGGGTALSTLGAGLGAQAGLATAYGLGSPEAVFGFGSAEAARTASYGAIPLTARTVPLLASAVGGVAGGMSTGQPRTKLFVGNLPTDIQQEAIRMVFSHYGQVTNIHVMQGKSKSGQACAFVEYSSPLEAETAILTLHEKYEIRPGEGAIMVKYSNSPPRASPY